MGPAPPASEVLGDDFFQDDGTAPRAAAPTAGPAPPPAPAAEGAGGRPGAERLNRLGLEAYRAGRTADALALYEAALRADPTYHWAHYNVACMYAIQGEIDPVVAHLVAYRRSSPKRVNLKKRVRKDKDFARLLADPRFTDWLERQ